MRELQPLVRAALHLVDVVGTLHFTPKMAKKSEEVRKRVRATRWKRGEKDRTEAAVEKKRLDKKRRDEEFDLLTPEQQRKRESKDYKKQLRKRMGASGKIKMMKM